MRRLLLAVLACLAPFALASSAEAATTVGSSTGSADISIGGNFTNVAAGPASRVPSDGILTSISLRAASPGAGTFAVGVFRPTAVAGTFTVVASVPVDAPAGTAHRLVTRSGVSIPVRAGDRLGITTAAGVFVSGSGSDPDGGYLVRNGDAATGTTWTSSGTAPGYRLLLGATLEADADGDGAADETQDGCPGSLSVAPPCEIDLVAGLAATPPSVLLGDVTTLTATARAAAGAATGVSATFTLPAGLELVAAAGDAGRCTGDRVVSCPLGTVLGGSAGTAFAVVRGTAAGPQSVTASVAATGGDVAPADNTAVTSVTVATVPAPLLPAPTKLCKVPKLTGLTKAKAARKLKAAGCATARFKGKGKGKGKVTRQAIPRGTRVAPTTRVRVTLKPATRRRAGARSPR